MLTLEPEILSIDLFDSLVLVGAINDALIWYLVLMSVLLQLMENKFFEFKEPCFKDQHDVFVESVDWKRVLISFILDIFEGNIKVFLRILLSFKEVLLDFLFYQDAMLLQSVKRFCKDLISLMSRLSKMKLLGHTHWLCPKKVIKSSLHLVTDQVVNHNWGVLIWIEKAGQLL